MRLTINEAIQKRVFLQEQNCWHQPCIWCQTFFPVYRNRRYCSETCNVEATRDKYKNQIIEKTCINCNAPFTTTNNIRVYCSANCGNNLRGARWYSANPNKVKERREKIKEQSWIKYALSRVRHRAKKSNLLFDLKPSDLALPEYCPVLNIKLNYSNKGSGYHFDSPSLDRICPEKGYTKNNTRVISARANLLKNDATVEELEMVLRDLKQLKGDAE